MSVRVKGNHHHDATELLVASKDRKDCCWEVDSLDSSNVSGTNGWFRMSRGVDVEEDNAAAGATTVDWKPAG